MTNIRNDIATRVREVDGNNELAPSALAHEVVGYLRSRGLIGDEETENAVDDFVYDATRGTGVGQPKPMGAAPLADAIVDHFNLDEGNPCAN